MLVRILLLCCLVGLTSAETRWTKIETPNFTLYALDGEKEARRAAQQFEEAHRFFESIWRKLGRDKPIRIVSFNDVDKAYEKLTEFKKSGAFYLGASDADYIVMRDLSPASFPIAVHEYMHLVVRHAGLKVPVWLNEGLAEVYSTITERREKGKDQVLIGSLPPTHLPFLNSTTMFQLPELLAVDHQSKIYRAGGPDTSRFYAQSWALTHMLMLHKDYTPHFGKILGAAEKEVVTPGMVERATGKALGEIEKDLDRYIRQAMYRGLLYDTKLKGKDAEIRVATMAAGEDELLLAGIKLYREDWRAHVAEAETVAAKYGQNAFAHETLALLAQRQRDREKEVAALRQALRLNSTSPFLVIRYAQLTYEDQNALPLAVNSLQRTLEAYPDHIDVRIELSMALNRWKRSVQAYAITVPVKTVTPKKASRFFFARAYSLFGNKQYDEARTEAARAQQYAIEEHDLRNAANLLLSIDNYMAAVASYAAQKAAAPVAPDSGGVVDETRPRLKHGAELPDPLDVVARPVEATIEEAVTFENFDCEARVFTVKKGDGKLLRLYLEDPQMLEVRGTGSNTVDLTCGPQKHQQLSVSFHPREDANRKTAGLLRRLHFLGFYQ
jgi:hypothetical protein